MTVTAVSGPTPYNTRPSWKVEKSPPLPRVPRFRKGPKARTWTSQEETYLLESRGQRLPYKRIAAQLSKSELACRLHFHQLTVARQRHPHQRALEADDNSFDVHLARRAYSSSPLPSELPPHYYSQPPLATLQPLPSMASLLSVGTSHQGCCKSLPQFGERCSCPLCCKEVHDQFAKPMLPPPTRLLSPFEPTRPRLGLVHFDSTWPSPPPAGRSHHRSTSSITSSSTSDIRPWTPLSSRSSSISSLAGIYHTSPPISHSGSLTDGERCSVRSILNHNAAYTT